MGVRTRYHLLSALHLLLLVLVFGAGVFFLGLPSAPRLRYLIERALIDHPQAFTWCGYFLLAIGALLFWGLFLFNRGQYYHLEMGGHRASLDLSLIQQYVEKYWKEVFPTYQGTTEVVLFSDQKIELIAEMPGAITSEEWKGALAKIERELSAMLAKQFGYEQQFYITVQLKGQKK